MSEECGISGGPSRAGGTVGGRSDGRSLRTRLVCHAVMVGLFTGAAVMVSVLGCIPLPKGNLGTLLGGKTGDATAKQTDEAKRKQWVEDTPAEDADYLRTPEAGLVAYSKVDYETAVRDAAKGRAAGAATVPPLAPANVVIVRAPVRDWQSSPGSVEGAPAVRNLIGWAALGRRAVGLRFDEAATRDLPEDLARAVPPVPGKEGLPMWWDATYFDHHSTLVTALAKRLETDLAERLQVVVIGGADWDSATDWRASDPTFTDDKYVALVKDLVALYHVAFTAKNETQRRRFPYVQLHISRKAVERCPAKAAELAAVLKEKGVRLIDDAPGAGEPAWAAGFEWMLGEAHAPSFEGKDLERSLRSLVEKRKPRYVVLSRSAETAQELCTSRQRDLELGASALGPRLRVVGFKYPRNNGRSQSITIEMNWVNDGTVAPALPYKLDINFLQADNRPVGTVAPLTPVDEGSREVPSDTWKAGFARKFVMTSKTPPVAIGGIVVFNVAVAMVDGDDSARRLPLAMQRRTADSRYFLLGQINVGN